ncbi:hypothetical protein SBY92_001262 [Candida maltosa Xu316]|uniref:Large ribosomal subunit protein mL50 n=1 Tax=Candida maltosa (strain Xu316) TaxID=1245528 RepID=M3JBH5_CANMX|nr:hypothetical protein G210_5745 [Candida maltosa Xu316]
MISRQLITNSRSLTTTSRSLSWFGDLFGKNKKQVLDKRQEIITKQDDMVNSDETSYKITHLGYKNSTKYNPVKPRDIVPETYSMTLKSWKSKNYDPRDYEEVYSKRSKLQGRVNAVVKEITGESVGVRQYRGFKLDDLEVRFKVVKGLQSKLGIEIGDYVISKCHDLDSLYVEIEKIVSARWKSERNPNAIVLRSEDFDAGNVYLNQELNDYEKRRVFDNLVREMKKQENQQPTKTA